VDALLKLLSIMGHDKKYEEIAKTSQKKKVKNMCEVVDRIIKTGNITLLIKQINDKIITISDAAKYAGISEAEFQEEICKRKQKGEKYV